MSANREQFAKKLEAFTNSLSPEETTYFKLMIERGGLSDADLNKVTGGAGALAHTAGLQLNATNLSRLMCW